MPIVPIEENKVGLATATDAKFRAPDYSGSGLEALGAGLARLGEGGQQLASGIENRRRKAAEAVAAAMLDDKHHGNIDDAAAKQAYVDYSDGSARQLYGEDGLFNKQGVAAHAAFPDVVLALADAHDKATAQLDKIQRDVVAPALQDRLRTDVARAADHVRQQGVAEQKWQSTKLQQAAWRDAVNHADDPQLHDHHIETGTNAIRQQAKIDNVGDKLLARQLGDYKSATHADTIAALVQRDPVHAAGWYARYGDNLNQRDKMRVESTLGPALADARAAADVDAASSARDPTVAPANPHAGNDATLLLKMQGITPMMDQTELPALMQRYGNDPAKAWAAFEAGPERIDRLIAERGEDWYAGVDDDTRRFVGRNMRMLAVTGSPQERPFGRQVSGVAGEATPFSRGIDLGNADFRDSPASPADFPGLQPVHFLVPSEDAAPDAGDNIEEDTRYRGPPDSPVPLRKGMKVTPELGAWLQLPSRSDEYSLNVAPDFITRFRARNPEFVRLEQANFEQSKIKPSSSPRIERTLLVYEKIDDPTQHRIVPVVGEPNITKFYDPVTKIRLPFGEFPQIKGYRLIIAEHTHPTGVNRTLPEILRREKPAWRGPSKADLAYAWLNPDVHFIIKSVYGYNMLSGSADEEYYYGKGFNGQGYHQ